MRWFPAMLCHAGPSSLVFFFSRDVKFSRIVIYRSKFRRMDCTLNWSYIHYGGLHCDSKYKQKIILVSHTRPLKFISAPRKANILLVNYDSWWQHQMSVRELRHDRPSGWFSKSRGLSASVSFLSSPPPPRSFTCAIFRAVFDSRSSFFAPKPHRNACYAG